MNYNNIILGIFSCIAILGCSLISPKYKATADLPKGLQVSIAITPTSGFSLQSEWDRQLTIRYKDQTISTPNSSIGGWISANLYRHRSGNLLIHEYNGHCIEVSLEPLKFVDPPLNCHIFSYAGIQESPDTINSHQKKLDGYHTPSIYFDADYIGAFEQVYSGDKKIQFSSFKKINEIKFPR